MPGRSISCSRDIQLGDEPKETDWEPIQGSVEHGKADPNYCVHGYLIARLLQFVEHFFRVFEQRNGDLKDDFPGAADSGDDDSDSAPDPVWPA